MPGSARKQHREAEIANFELLQNVARRTISAVQSRAHAQSALPIQTGISSIDQAWRGLERARVVPIVGSSRADLTRFATSLAFNIATAYEGEVGDNGNIFARRGGVVAYYVTTLTAEQIGTMILSEYTGIESARIRAGDIDDEEFKRLSEASQMMQKVPLYVDATEDGSNPQLSSRARRLLEKTGLDVLIVENDNPAGLRSELENIANKLNICILYISSSKDDQVAKGGRHISVGHGQYSLNSIKFDLLEQVYTPINSEPSFLDRAKHYRHEEVDRGIDPHLTAPAAIAETLGGGAVLKRKIRTMPDLTRLVLDGIPTPALDALTSLGFTQADIEMLVAPKRTLSRRRATATLLPSEGDAAVRLAKAYLLAAAVLGEKSAAITWLHSPQHAKLGGRTPLEFLTTQTGGEAVEEMLMQAAFGITA